MARRAVGTAVIAAILIGLTLLYLFDFLFRGAAGAVGDDARQGGVSDAADGALLRPRA